MSTAADPESLGQQRAVGHTLLGLGGVAATLGAVGSALGVDLRFIDGHAMLFFGLVLAGVGLWQRVAAH